MRVGAVFYAISLILLPYLTTNEKLIVQVERQIKTCKEYSKLQLTFGLEIYIALVWMYVACGGCPELENQEDSQYARGVIYKS